MSLAVVTYVPEGIVMASDSRQSVTVEGKHANGEVMKFETVNSDAVTKTFLLDQQRVGISNFGQDLLGGVPMASHIKRFSEEVLNANEGVESIAGKLRSYIRQDFHDADTGFHICGYQKEGKVSVPHVWYVHIKNGKVERRNIKQSNKETAYGATWSGQGDVVMSLISPVKVQVGKEEKTVRAPAPVLWDAMAIQDAVDFAIYAIRTTIDTMRFQARAKNVGGPIDVLVIKPDGAHWIQRKELIP